MHMGLVPCTANQVNRPTQPLLPSFQQQEEVLGSQAGSKHIGAHTQ